MFGLSECSKTRNPKLFNDLFYLNPLYSVLKTEKKKRKKAFWNQRILKRRLCILVWIEHILKPKLFENVEFTIIMIFPYPCFTQTQIQKRTVIVVSKSSDVVWKTFDAFLEWILPFQILLVQCGRTQTCLPLEHTRIHVYQFIRCFVIMVWTLQVTIMVQTKPEISL